MNASVPNAPLSPISGVQGAKTRNSAADSGALFQDVYPQDGVNPLHHSSLPKKGSDDEGNDDGHLTFKGSKVGFGTFLTALDIIGLFSERSPFFHFVQAGMKPKALRERAKSLWSAVAIISALIATIALANLSSAQPLQETMTNTSYQAYGLLNFLSGLMNIFAATVITVAWAGLESTPMEMTSDYFKEFYYVAALPGTLFVIGGVFLLLAYLTLVQSIFSSVVLYITAATGIAVVSACLLLQKVMHGRNLGYLQQIKQRER